MFLQYFGLTDNPFSIAPNPDYLYMSPRHKEALAHLTFGLRESGGFVMLTGEVGTGKTTVSRKLLQQLPDSTQVAMILNPTLSAIELLATVCDELNIETDPNQASLKYFTDKILQKLADNHNAGKNTVLMIDEAQHLLPEVLEQLRLLTNLETNREKLLKVVLIGQPELQQLLKRNELRQLAQRITARYHLLPLNADEVKAYVNHRLSVANGDLSVFSAATVRTMYRVTAGIPRVINLLCDRAMTLAFTQQKPVVKKHLFLAAAEQILGEDVVQQRLRGQQTLIYAGIFFSALVGGYLWGMA
ncbi:MAG: AAA family ATPase [Pseudomonadota bacterium]|uniref:AAA family ATPase n=1 Tax=Alteromonas alba TaxID=2079529 RepID=A0A2S9VBI6_9ALTE|nr:AAA family ATPase [Alteromonas alba]MCP4866164.1 AAA family ATPase [Alteromonas sp.]MDY6925558.1 AAA family ATPase [Pseudomonadota bacterium]PRO73841.1 AAA family ATPase [Alteromonas alba]